MKRVIINNIGRVLLLILILMGLAIPQGIEGIKPQVIPDLGEVFTAQGIPYADYVEAASREYDLPAALILALIKAESGFNPRARSNRGAVGLMQLTPVTAEHLGASNLYNPKDNIMAGAAYVRELLDRFDGNLKLALAAYNAGPSAVERYGDIPPYRQTQRYIPKVLEHYRRYQLIAYN